MVTDIDQPIEENTPEVVETIELNTPEKDKIETVEIIEHNENVEPQDNKPEPKKAGRPKGGKDKNPRPSRKKQVQIEEVPEEELPRALPDSLPIPQPTESDKAALMLELLRRQAQMRKNQKQQLWKSWFI